MSNKGQNQSQSVNNRNDGQKDVSAAVRQTPGNTGKMLRILRANSKDSKAVEMFKEESRNHASSSKQNRQTDVKK